MRVQSKVANSAEMSTHAEQTYLDIIYKEMQKFNQVAYCVKADVIRVAPDLLTELIMAMKSDVIRYSMYTMDYSSGKRFIFGAQVETEPYFPSMTFRIEGGCDHRWHELEGEKE